jgi:hypothetical protein
MGIWIHGRGPESEILSQPPMTRVTVASFSEGGIKQCSKPNSGLGKLLLDDWS